MSDWLRPNLIYGRVRAVRPVRALIQVGELRVEEQVSLDGEVSAALAEEIQFAADMEQAITLSRQDYEDQFRPAPAGVRRKNSAGNRRAVRLSVGSCMNTIWPAGHVCFSYTPFA